MRDHVRLLASPRWIWRHPGAARAKLVEFQRRRLRSLLHDAYLRVAFYRELFDGAGIAPRDIRDTADLLAVPLTSKGALRERPVADVVARDAPRLIERRTSGSSGNPFVIRRTQSEDRLLFLLRLRAQLLLGIRPSDQIASVIEPRPASSGGPTPWARAQRWLRFMRTHSLDGLRPPDDLFDELERLAPDVLLGYPSSLERAARIRLERPGSPLRPRLVVTGGESLRGAARRALETAFPGAVVLDVYGAYEFNLLAWECPVSHKLHVCDDNVILEVLRDGRPARPGEWGEVVVTGLHGHAMPFIRYRQGDVAMRADGPCPCGQPFALLAGIQGRTVDYFRLPGGRWVHPYTIGSHFVAKHGDWIDRHQLVQESETRVLLRVAPRRAPPPGALAGLRALGADVLGDAVELAVEVVERLEAAPGGKFHPYCSRLAGPETEVDWSRAAGADLSAG